MQNLATIGDRNGILNGCKGKNCATPCCNIKKVTGTDNKVYEYVAMINEEEKQKIIETGIPAIFENLERVTSTNPNTWKSTGELVIALKGGCLGANGCLIPHAKGTSCKSYPYQVNIDDPSGLPQPPFDIMGCPSIVEIVSDESNTKMILETRKSAGYSDNQQYIDALIFALSILQAPDPKRKFLNDRVYMQAIL